MGKAFIPSVEIDRDSDEPLYQQIARPLEDYILSGLVPAGTLIEDEVSMAARLSVARPTARRAIQELVGRGLVTRRRGVGTRVNPRQVHRPSRLKSLSEELEAAGYEPSTRVLSYIVEAVSPDEALTLGLPAGEGVVRVERLRLADGEPVALLRNIIPADVAPSWKELGEDSLYNCMKARGAEMTTARQVINARPATTQEAGILGENEGAPLLTMYRVGSDQHGRAIEVSDHVYRPSRYSFEFSLFAG